MRVTNSFLLVIVYLIERIIFTKVIFTGPPLLPRQWEELRAQGEEMTNYAIPVCGCSATVIVIAILAGSCYVIFNFAHLWQ